MTLSQRLRRATGVVLGTAAVIEFGAVVWVLVYGPFDVRVGPIPLLARDASKPFVVAVGICSVAIWLLEPLLTSRARSRLAAGCQGAAWTALVLSVPILAAPFFRPDFLIGHDGGVHQTYAFFMDRALQQGQFPVRWVEGIAAGTGQPLFNFYQVGFYYLVALIHRCGPGLSLAIKLAVALLWAAGSGFMFLLCRRLGVMPGVVAAAVFAWSPYLLLDAYVRTAYPEFSAIAFAPGVLWSIEHLLRTGRTGFVCGLAVVTALLLVCHIPTAVIIAPLAAAYMLGSWILYRHAARSMLLAMTGALLGAGLAAFYVLPAIAELPGIHADRLTSAYFDYHRHFVRPEWWVNWTWGYGPSGDSAPDQLSLQIGIVQWVVIAAAVTMLAMPALRRGVAFRKAAVVFWLAVVGLSMWMMTAAASGVWDRIVPLSFIQFPWRLLMVPSLACAVLAATLLASVGKRTTQALIVICVITLQWYVTRDYREQAWMRDRAHISIDDPAWPSSEDARRWAFREAGYDPVSVTSAEAQALPGGRWTVTAGEGDVTAESDADARLLLTVRARDPIRLAVNEPFFPGWRISIDGRPVSAEIMTGSGYMEIAVPAGTHRVEAAFGRTGVRAAAESITLISAGIWIALLWRHRVFGGAASAVDGFAS